MVGKVVDNFMGKLVPDDQVASEDRKSIGSVGSGFGSVQHDSRLSKMIHQILGIKWGAGEVPGGPGTFLINSKCLVDRFLARKCFVQKL